MQEGIRRKWCICNDISVPVRKHDGGVRTYLEILQHAEQPSHITNYVALDHAENGIRGHNKADRLATLTVQITEHFRP